MKAFTATAPEEETATEEDPDVAAERIRVDQMTCGTNSIEMRSLCKVYPARGSAPPKLAVRSMSLGIPQGECFGLLGVNGAGKTSTMGMLTGDVSYYA